MRLVRVDARIGFVGGTAWRTHPRSSAAMYTYSSSVRIPQFRDQRHPFVFTISVVLAPRQDLAQSTPLDKGIARQRSPRAKERGVDDRGRCRIHFASINRPVPWNFWVGRPFVNQLISTHSSAPERASLSTHLMDPAYPPSFPLPQRGRSFNQVSHRLGSLRRALLSLLARLAIHFIHHLGPRVVCSGFARLRTPTPRPAPLRTHQLSCRRGIFTEHLLRTVRSGLGLRLWYPGIVSARFSVIPAGCFRAGDYRAVPVSVHCHFLWYRVPTRSERRAPRALPRPGIRGESGVLRSSSLPSSHSFSHS